MSKHLKCLPAVIFSRVRVKNQECKGLVALKGDNDLQAKYTGPRALWEFYEKGEKDKRKKQKVVITEPGVVNRQ